MTLCMAAICRTKNRYVIVATADSRAEKDWAGGEVAFKFGWAASPGWPALLAGGVSEAEDLLATCRDMLDPLTFTARNIFDKLNEVSGAHKRKLAERFVQKRLGISLERFLANGERELTPEVRSQVLYGIERLEFGCSLILLGYINEEAFIFSIDTEGEVTYCQNFSAIGTGSLIAESTLYQREQSRDKSIDRTLYHLYEASELARIAPGVGKTRYFAVLHPFPAEFEDFSFQMLDEGCLSVLAEQFEKYGPKKVGEIPEMELNYMGVIIRSEARHLRRRAEVTQQPPAKKRRAQKSKRKKSEGRP